MTHGVLSESSVSAPVVTHDRKGREGKGDRKGGGNRWLRCIAWPQVVSDSSSRGPRLASCNAERTIR